MSWVFEGVLLPHAGDGRILVSSGRLGARAEALPGRYGLPGLVDAHAHLTVRRDHTLGDAVLASERLGQYAAHGVGTVRDVGGQSSVTLSLAGHPQPGLPVVLAAGRFLAPEGRYFPRLHQPVPPEELLHAAAAEVSHGAGWLKLIGDFPRMTDRGPVPGSLAPTYDLDSVCALVQLAHERGARVAVHTQSEHAAALVGAGVDSIEHGEWLTEDAVRVLGARGGAWTPTLAAITDPPADASQKRRRYAAEASERLRTLLPLAISSGVRVLAGTDAVATVPHEIALLARHGLDPVDALAAGSTAAEQWLQPGPSVAGSLVTYHSDPRDEPAALESPAAVIVRGRRIL